jgi:hypothetical protein
MTNLHKKLKITLRLTSPFCLWNTQLSENRESTDYVLHNSKRRAQLVSLKTSATCFGFYNSHYQAVSNVKYTLHNSIMYVALWIFTLLYILIMANIKSWNMTLKFLLIQFMLYWYCYCLYINSQCDERHTHNKPSVSIKIKHVTS